MAAIKNIFCVAFITLLCCNNNTSQTIAPSASSTTVAVTPMVATATVTVPPIHCPFDMVYVEKNNFCIDKYEWPNKKGEYPDFALNAYQAQDFCYSVKKRLCTHGEWVQACVGSANLSYGYAHTWHKDTCNDNAVGYVQPEWEQMSNPVEWKKYAKTLYKGVPSGSKEACFSNENGERVYDMIGNVREWVTDPYGLGGYSFESSFWFGTMAGPLGCGFVIRNHSPGFSSYEVGTRCCSASK
jgi:sulfatase modifying factor 1